MSNMSYCRFENTSQDLRDCLSALEEMRDNPTPDNRLSDGETKAAKSLLETCGELMFLASEILKKDLEEAVEGDYMGELVDSMNDSCEEGPESDNGV